MADQAEPGRTSSGRFVPGVSGNPSGVSRKNVARHDSNLQENLSTLAQFAQIPVPQSRWDGWNNPGTGIGIYGSDKRLGTNFYTDFITHRDAMEMWLGDDIAARAIESVPAECFRQGYELVIDDENNFGSLKEDVETHLEDLLINDELEKIFQFERAYGGGALLLGAIDDGTMDQPLVEAKIKSFDWVTALEPIELFPLYYYNDPLAPKYGQPLLYQLNTAAVGPTAPGEKGTMPANGTLIHESRLVVFKGIRVSKYQPFFGGVGPFWGTSMLTRLKAALRDWSTAFAAAGIVVSEFSQGVLQVENLAALVAEKGPDILSARLRGMEMSKSVAHALLIDKNETYTRQTASLSGLSEVLTQLSSRLAAAVDMPLTLLMGQSPKGLGNEGDSDIRFYYDRIKNIQTRRLMRPIRRIVRLAMLAMTKKPPKKWVIKFKPLWQQPDTEVVTARKTQGDLDVEMIGAGVLTANEVRQSRYSGEYSFETQIDDGMMDDQVEGTTGEPDDATMAAMGRTPPAGGAPGAPDTGAVEPAKTAMNGAQISSLIAVITAANTKEISRPSAVAVLMTAFGLTDADAEAMLGPKDFTPPPTILPPPVSFGGGGGGTGGASGGAAPPKGAPPAPAGAAPAAAKAAKAPENLASDEKLKTDAAEREDGLDDELRDKYGKWTRDPDSEGERHASHFLGVKDPENPAHTSVASIHPERNFSKSQDVSGYRTQVNGRTIGNYSGVKSAKTAVAEHLRSVALAERANEQGGFTFDPKTGKFPTSGYAVSVHPGQEQIVQTEKLPASVLAGYLKQHASFVDQNPGAHVGAWYDKEAKKWYLDISHVESDRNKATELAAAHNQEGIYDLAKGQTIITKSADKRRIDAPTAPRREEVLLRPEEDDGAGDGRRDERTRGGGRGGAGEEEVRIDFDPDEARDPDGKWSSTGGLAAAREIGARSRANAEAARAAVRAQRMTPTKPPAPDRVVGEPTQGLREQAERVRALMPDLEKDKVWQGAAAGAKDTMAAYQHDGKWDPERVAAVHDRYIAGTMRGVPVVAAPTVYMTGGGPAVGKSTGILNNPRMGYPDAAHAAHVDPDSAKLAIPEYLAGKALGDKSAATFVHPESAHMSREGIAAALRARHDVVYDSAGDSGVDELSKRVQAMRDAGAKCVVMNYATVSVDEAMRRSEHREKSTKTADGGRHVPEDTIRGYHRAVSITAPAALQRGIFDEAHVWDTTDAKNPTHVASYTKENGFQVHDKSRWDAFVAKGKVPPIPGWN